MTAYDYDDTDAIIDADFDSPFADLRELSDKVVEYWEEDYDFESLLEEFDLTTKDAFFALIEAGLIDTELMESFLVD
jgi:uncharacterized protein (DUF433 family)